VIACFPGIGFIALDGASGSGIRVLLAMFEVYEVLFDIIVGLLEDIQILRIASACEIEANWDPYRQHKQYSQRLGCQSAL